MQGITRHTLVGAPEPVSGEAGPGGRSLGMGAGWCWSIGARDEKHVFGFAYGEI